MVLVLSAAALAVLAILGLTLNTYKHRELALANSFAAGEELSHYIRMSAQEEAVPDLHAGAFLQVVPAERPDPEEDASLQAMLFAGDGLTLEAALDYDGNLPSLI